MAGGTERAIIDFVTQGTAEAEGSAEKITVDLTGTEKAANAAKDASVAAGSAAKEATAEVRKLASEVRHAVHALARAVEIAKGLAKAAGADELSDGMRATDSVAQGLSGAASGARAGGQLGAFFGPEGIAAGAAIGGLLGGLNGAISSLQETGKKLEERTEKLAEINGKAEDRDLVQALLKQSGLAQADYITGGGSRQVQ